MFETIKNAFATKEIRIKIWMTLLFLLVYRIGCYIPVPGINASEVAGLIEGNDFLSIISTITGGSMSNGTLFALGIVPFINAFIIMQLLTLVIPALERLSKEGEDGKRKLTQITRYFAILLGIVQAIGIALTWKSVILPTFGSTELTTALIIFILVGGSTMVMWLGERITEYGIGNGTSLIIFVGIISTAGTSFLGAFDTVGRNPNNLWRIFGIIILMVLVFLFIVFMDLSERRVSVQYAKQIKGNKVYGGQSTHIPIKINASGVMPIIFASSFLMFPQMIMSLFWPDSKAYAWYAKNMGSGTWVYFVMLPLLILFFAYFYAQIQFNPEDVAKNIQQYGGTIPGIRQGKATAEYLKKINNRITLFGAIFLAIISLVPTFLFQAIGGQGLQFGNAFSATGLLIVVSVALEINKQLESQIMMRHYKGFLQ
ncbi:MAG: preprotein translocase subunit SecY [Christensenellales bacterium]|jgi:preprotein translocase subunit SecY